MKNLKSVAFVANGSITDDHRIKEKILQHDMIVSVDGGHDHLDRLGITADVFIGDADSSEKIHLQKYAHTEKHFLPTDKDLSDLQIAVDTLVALGSPERMTLFASVGNRTDHSINNLHLLTLHPNKLFLQTESEIAFAINKRTKLILEKGETISLLPMNGPVSGIITKGLQWELTGDTLDHRMMGISNLATSTHVEINVEKGDLICYIHTRKDVQITF